MADYVTYDFKQGDDFYVPMTLTDPANNGTPVDITGWTIRAQVRYARKLIAELSVTIINPTLGQFVLAHPYTQTHQWPIRLLKCDIQFDPPMGRRISSKTFLINCEEDQTKEPDPVP